ncbi:MAG: hypothetical protein IIA33_06920, partial [Planctomycetes bacterium]|nr:hypothetical protein [Planctomycetota bacterium]
MRLTRRMGPDYRACATGRLLRLFVWSSCLAAVLTLRPFAAAQDARPGFGEDDPRIKTSAPIFFDRVDTVRVTPFGNVSDVGVRTASAGSCEQQSTYTDADFDGPGDYSIVFGLAETEIMAASYTIAPEFFPIEIQSVEMVFAQIGNQDMVTELELLILKGTPNQGQLVATIPHTLNFPACDDGIFCNGTEACVDGSCVSGLAPCFGQICNENIAACVECLSAASCDDGDSCTLDTCNAVGQCEFTINVFGPCNDGEVCTIDDTCNAVGQCGGVPDVGAPCNDGDVCTMNDTCDAVGQCGGQPNVGESCDDGDGCTDPDVCDADGQCVGEPCDDGLFCNGLDRCVGDVCVTATPPCVPESCDEEADVCECVADADCVDGNPCTDDVCMGSVCQFPNNSLGCNDLDPCTNGDACAGGSCAGTPVDCDDGDACTQDTCNPGDGQCFHDTVQCPADQHCQPGTGNCVECLENTDCDDGLFCNGTATCNNASCVASSALPCPGQLCDEDSDPHCFDSDQGCDAINILIDLSANPVLVENNGTDTFSVGFRIVTHNNQTENPCTANPPANSNAFPTVDVSGVQNEVENWVLMVNCGPLGCPAGWNRFEDLFNCEPDGDWVLRATWAPQDCNFSIGACCFGDGNCEPDIVDFVCDGQGGRFLGDGVACPVLCDGACCFANGDCFELTSDACEGLNGTYTADGRLCTDIPDPCPD